MTVKLFTFLAIGTLAMGIPILTLSRRDAIPEWKAALATFLLTLTGTAGTYLMYWVENGRIGGLSFFGAVFLVPVVFLLAAPALRLTYELITDLCAVGECIMLALMKVHCILGGCCIGRALFTLADGTHIRFPSREVEMVVALCLFVLLFRWGLRGKNRGRLYPWFLVLYGSTRFVLNIFREAWVTRTMLLPFGNIWSLVATAIGMVWLLAAGKVTKRVK